MKTIDKTNLDDFDKIRHFRITSRHLSNTMIVFCQSDDADKLKERFSMCKIEEIQNTEAGCFDGEEDFEDWNN